jgi:chemotaxis protein CheD
MTEADIGGRNIRFVREFIATEGLRVAAEDLGDIYPRKVVYEPKTGKVQVKKLRKIHNDTIAQREQSYRSKLDQKPLSGEIELFD